MKICALASVYDVQVIPHGVSMQATAQVAFSQNTVIVPMLEYLIAEQERFQHFLKHQVKPIDGFFTPPDVPGVGMELNADKIESEKEIDWTN